MPFEPESLLLFAGRLLLGGAFVYAGLRNLANRPMLTQILTARGVPAPRVLLAAGIVLQILAGALLIANLWPALAAVGLMAFLVVATAIFHNFWDHEGAERAGRINGVVSNAALFGSFLMVAVGL
ncbi:DoxX family protein [Mesorhizobium xinjiangense]|uniref:DoxX family protein n=1 Tax=Mesorhizobium xinjiangense TaxID=2678685 RepID=UPI0012ECC599|nr:DoxX family protein [Mesorhizobium xinjiangense]